MSFASCSRPVSNCARRSLSTTATLFSQTPASHTTLPPAKMRALISLYHQAETWITPENLSQRIDEAFVPVEREVPKGEVLFSAQDLAERVARIRQAPKMIQWGAGSKPAAQYESGTTWSDGRSAREMKVMEALYGVDHSVPGPLQPGLEMLLEGAQAARQRHAEDKAKSH